MSSDQVYELLKEVLPELEAKIREEIVEQYEAKLQEMQEKCEEEVAKILDQKQKQLQELYRPETCEQNSELIKRISMLEGQRKTWLQLETQYQHTINQLAAKIVEYEEMVEKLPPQKSSRSHRMKPQSRINIGNISPIPLQISHTKNTTENGKIFKATKQRNLPKQNKPLKNTQKESQIFFKPQIQKSQKLNEYLELSDGKSDLSKGSQKSVELRTQNGEQACLNHYRSVLSPPKNDLSTLKCQKEVKKGGLFWNQQKKKHLLSLIKLQ